MAELGGRKRQVRCSMTVNIGSAHVMQLMPAIPIEQRDEEEGG